APRTTARPRAYPSRGPSLHGLSQRSVLPLPQHADRSLLRTAVLARWLDALGAPARALRAARLLRRGGFVRLEIDGPLVEIEEPRCFWSLRRRRRVMSVARIRELVERISTDRKVDGLLVEIRSLHAGAATATSLRRALSKLKGTEKKLAVYLPSGAGS